MRNTLILLLMVIGLISCEKDSSTISLDGTWKFFASNSISEEDLLKGQQFKWDTITVPGNWDTKEQYSTYVGKGYYQRDFEVPGNWEGSQIRVRFEAVYETAHVWLNGKFLGEHVGGYTPFEFNISSLVVPGKQNTLTVMADNTYRRGAWWAWGGISRSVTLLRNNDVRLVHQHITAVPDFRKEVVDFVFKYQLENNSEVPANISVSSQILSPDGTVFKTLMSKAPKVLPDSPRDVEQTFSVDLSEVRLWHYNDPGLYLVNTTVLVDGKEVDQQSDKFGIRKLEARGEQLYFNNEVIYVNGINRVHDHPDYGNTEPDHLIKRDILDMKELGTVFSRMMHAPLSKNILEFCDSVGYLIIEEIPVWGDDDPQTYKDNPLTKQWLKEMIERDYNHPCVIGWSVGNELRDTINPWSKKIMTEDQFQYANSMLDYVETLDTTRLKTYVSITSYHQGANPTNEPYHKVDLLCINSYSDAPKVAAKTHAAFPGKPIFVSEIGIKQIGPAPHAKLSDKLVNQLIDLKSLPYVVGSSIWCYNDYRSDYKGTPESGFREWGVVSERREKKEAWHQLKEIYDK